MGLQMALLVTRDLQTQALQREHTRLRFKNVLTLISNIGYAIVATVILDCLKTGESPSTPHFIWVCMALILLGFVVYLSPYVKLELEHEAAKDE